MNFQQLRIIRETVRQGYNLTEVANSLYTSQPGVSKHIRDLEEVDINKFRAVRYNSKCELDDQSKDHFGVIADEVAEAGITELVNYGSDGEVEGFQYERLTVVLLKKLQVLESEFKAYKEAHP